MLVRPAATATFLFTSLLRYTFIFSLSIVSVTSPLSPVLKTTHEARSSLLGENVSSSTLRTTVCARAASASVRTLVKSFEVRVGAIRFEGTSIGVVSPKLIEAWLMAFISSSLFTALPAVASVVLSCPLSIARRALRAGKLNSSALAAINSLNVFPA
jgi:hypothetical protein